MWQFIVSGYVPGTTVQITFDHVANIAAILAMLVFSAVLLREHRTFYSNIANQLVSDTTD